MKRTVVVLAAFAMLALAGVTSAQQGNRDVGRQLPLEGAPLAIPGPYEVTSGPAFGSPRHIVFHPADLGAFPERDTLPVMAWGNGGCAIDGTRYSDFLSTIASHGFLVLTTVSIEGEENRRQTADDLRAAFDWAEAENARAGSPLAGKIAAGQMAVMGQSCGGFLSYEIGADARIDTIGPFNSGITGDDASQLADLHGPVLIINGGEVDFMYEPSAENFDAINHVPVFYGARDNAGHTATVFHPGGGEYANVASNWLRWTLKGDDVAARMFRGDDCTLCTNSNWETRSKGLE
jgi:hypothetical protein